MSVTNYRGEKVTLSRVGKDQFWKGIHDHYAHEDTTKWKQLAMLSLHETAGWPLEQVGYAFHHHKGHVLRSIEQIKTELRRRFDVDWDETEGDDENRADETGRAEGGSVQPSKAIAARVA